jgi:hypothetical protein
VLLSADNVSAGSVIAQLRAGFTLPSGSRFAAFANTGPPLRVPQLTWGQQIDKGVINNPAAPAVPFCCQGGTISMMFWMQDSLAPSLATAASTVAAWIGTGSGKTAPGRVVYYLNHPNVRYDNDTAIFPGQTRQPDGSIVTGYSPCSIVVLPFIYPYAPGDPFYQVAPVDPLKPPDQLHWGFCYGSWTNLTRQNVYVAYNAATMANLQAWRAYDPANRAVMVSVGGAMSYLPPTNFAVWAKYPTAVCDALADFFVQFQAANGWALDGLDIDYEDSAGCNPSNHSQTSPSLALVGPGGSAGPPPSPYQTATIALGVIAGVAVIVIIVLACLWNTR